MAGNDQEPGTWYLNYTSGYSIPWAYPGALATGMLGLPGWGAFPAGQGVNSKLYGWIAGKRPTVRYGVIVMDFPQQPYGDLIWDIVKANTFMSSAVFEPVQAS